MTEERRSRAYARRRDLRETPGPVPVPVPGPAWPGPGHVPADDDSAGGPTTQELALYRPDAVPVRPMRRGDVELPPASPDGDRGERTRAFVERWSLWAAGLGRPPRGPSGGRRYPGRESMVVPGMVLAAALGVAGVIGLVSGVLVTMPGRDAAVAAAVAPTVTVTEQVTLPAVTETATRTRTRTRTIEVTPEQAAPAAPQILQPGSQGPEVTQLQQDLALLQIYQGAPNGTYDEPTRAAVQNFQARYGVNADPPGVAGAATLEALARAVGRA